MSSTASKVLAAALIVVGVYLAVKGFREVRS